MPIPVKTTHTSTRILVTCLPILFLFGCASYNAQTQSLMSEWNSGNFDLAVQQVNDQAARHTNDNSDVLLWKLEQGAILRGARKLNQSLQAFKEAEEKVQSAEGSAKIQVADEAIALVTNLSALPYQGYHYDRIMLNTYQAINYLAMGNADAARVELNRAQERQRSALNDNAKRIEKAEESARKGKGAILQDGSSYVDKARNDAKLQAQLDAIYKQDDGVSVYADYVNPFTVFLDGLFFLFNPYNQSDLERARKSLKRVSKMVTRNQYIRQDLQLASEALYGAPVNDLTYVILETGSAPHREEVRIDIPLFLVSQEAPYVGAAFPRLAYNKNFLSRIQINAGSATFYPKRICSMDSVIKAEFNNELPIVVTKTLIAVGTKAMASYAINEALDSNILAQSGSKVITSIYQLTANRADLRSWRSLPKEFQYCRFETPEGRVVNVRNPDSGEVQSFTVEPGNINIIYIRATTATAPMSVYQFTIPPTRRTLVSP